VAWPPADRTHPITAIDDSLPLVNRTNMNSFSCFEPNSAISDRRDRQGNDVEISSVHLMNICFKRLKKLPEICHTLHPSDQAMTLRTSLCCNEIGSAIKI
jgi:hypothetical protein